MCSGIFQPLFILYITCDLICCNFREAKACWKCAHLFKPVSTKRLYDCYVKQWLAHVSRFCTSHLLSPLLFSIEAMSFSSSICLFVKSKYNIFRFFFISVMDMHRMTNLFFAFKHKNCRVYHECTFEFTDWLI